MKPEKKEQMVKKQKGAEIIRRNKKINMVNIGVLSIGLILMLLGYKSVAEHFIWLGFIIFLYTAGTTFMARRQSRK
ncbi:MAG: hypothetical protein ACLFMM_01870 [Methanohalobium sp.]|uniref:hypothetical protein n=1 Tax=Methanohalobium sp. TaxID=2837493 RepID=UPI003978FF40